MEHARSRVYNDENVNWRWCGISLALERKTSEGLRFLSEPRTQAEATASATSP
jgi:hypothetical protein